ncbi:OmpA family protein [Polluticaenibacter yanchengensis]|uniref:OmpA family protein n=1 Tax=Polluticaenibacter yanchengensis TaxID=3014562 RepID=A0ABT4ULF1_9BACT|nr:OmpA family protein [Chitinophagaceae bacterium LY-5]
MMKHLLTKKRLLPFLTLLLANSQGWSQNFSGFNTGNYAGVTGVSLQPASIADSRYKFDINLISTDVFFSNNYVLMDKDALLRFNKNAFKNFNTFKEKYLTESPSGYGNLYFANVSNRTQLPLSFMASIGKKSAIALNMQSRTMMQVNNVNGNIASLAYNNFFKPEYAGLRLDASNIKVQGINWAEAGLTYAQVLFDNKKHFLKGGITAKYLGGLSSFYLNTNSLTGGVNADSSIFFEAKGVEYKHNNDVDFSNLLDGAFDPDAKSVGFDIGLEYEFRGNAADRQKISKYKNQDIDNIDRRDENKYFIKIGVSLNDIGVLNFNRAPSSQNFRGNVMDWRVRDEHFNNIVEVNQAINSRTEALPSRSRYKINLPTAFSAQLDIRFLRDIYVNFVAYRPVQLDKSSDAYHFTNYGYYTITPRWETRFFGIYLPYTIADDNNFNLGNQLGAALRVGPVFFGSSNLGTVLIKDQLQAANLYAGLKVGIPYGRNKKTGKEFSLKNLFNSGKYTETATLMADSTYSDSSYIARKKQPKNQLLVDYQNGKIYSGANETGNVIVINNNNYYYNNVNTPGNSLKLDSNIVTINRERIIIDSLKIDSTIKQNEKLQLRIEDTLSAKQKELDSLINNLQKLRAEMLNSNVKDTVVKIIRVDSSKQVVDTLKPAAKKPADVKKEDKKTKKEEPKKYEPVIERIDADSLKNANKNDAAAIKKKDESINKLVQDSIALNKEIQTLEANAKEQYRQQMLDIQNTKTKDSIELAKKLTQLESENQEKLNAAYLQARTTYAKDSAALAKELDNVRLKNQQEFKTRIETERKKYLADSLKYETDLAKLRTQNEALLTRSYTYNQPVQTYTTAPSQAEMTNAINRQNSDYTRLLNDYNSKVNSLTSEIRTLQTRMNDVKASNQALARNYNSQPYSDAFARNNYNNTPITIPVPVPSNNNRDVFAVVPDTRYQRDTVYIKDTVYLNSPLSASQTGKVTVQAPKTDTVFIEKKVPQTLDISKVPPALVLFDVGKSNIGKIYQTRLNEFARLLKANNTWVANIKGFTDRTGSVAINEALSKKRAEAVKTYFINKAIAAGRINIEALGPVESNGTKANAQDRRVEVHLMDR